MMRLDQHSLIYKKTKIKIKERNKQKSNQIKETSNHPADLVLGSSMVRVAIVSPRLGHPLMINKEKDKNVNIIAIEN